MSILLKSKLIAIVFALAFGAGWFIYKSLKSKKTQASGQGGRKVWFSGPGRSGEMGYESPETSFKMYWELGGGDVVAILYLPKLENWEAATKIPLADRDAVINFIGEKAVELQTKGKGSYTIDKDWILVKS